MEEILISLKKIIKGLLIQFSIIIHSKQEEIARFDGDEDSNSGFLPEITDNIN